MSSLNRSGIFKLVLQARWIHVCLISKIQFDMTLRSTDFLFTGNWDFLWFRTLLETFGIHISTQVNKTYNKGLHDWSYFNVEMLDSAASFVNPRLLDSWIMCWSLWPTLKYGNWSSHQTTEVGRIFQPQPRFEACSPTIRQFPSARHPLLSGLLIKPKWHTQLLFHAHVQ